MSARKKMETEVTHGASSRKRAPARSAGSAAQASAVPGRSEADAGDGKVQVTIPRGIARIVLDVPMGSILLRAIAGAIERGEIALPSRPHDEGADVEPQVESFDIAPVAERLTRQWRAMAAAPSGTARRAFIEREAGKHWTKARARVLARVDHDNGSAAWEVESGSKEGMALVAAEAVQIAESIADALGFTETEAARSSR